MRFRVLTSVGRDAYGASVSALVGTTSMRRDVQPSASYLASSDPRVHFGLAEQTQIKNVIVTWPGGEQEKFGDFKALNNLIDKMLLNKYLPKKINSNIRTHSEFLLDLYKIYREL